MSVLECVINVSEGRDPAALAAFDAAAGPCLLDRHTDADHNRSVYTLAGPRTGPGAPSTLAGPPTGSGAGSGAGEANDVEAAARRLARAVVDTLDLGGHAGVHPRIGTLDVVPFVALESDPAGHLREAPIDVAVAARDRFAAWAGAELGLPCFLYGPTRVLPDLRKQVWHTLSPDTGPLRPHPRAGAAAVGARQVLVAFNVWLEATGVEAGPAAHATQAAKAIAAAIRRPGLRTLGLEVAGGAQVSCNLVDPWQLGPGHVFDLVAAQLPEEVEIDRAELVGLIPRAVLEAEPAHRWAELDLSADKTIEARLERAGLDGGSKS